MRGSGPKYPQMGNNIKNLKSAISAPFKWAGGQIEKEMKMNKAKDDKYRQEGEDMKAGRIRYSPARNPSIDTTSKKTKSGEIINPTKKDVEEYNKKYKTILPNNVKIRK